MKNPLRQHPQPAKMDLKTWKCHSSLWNIKIIFSISPMIPLLFCMSDLCFSRIFDPLEEIFSGKILELPTGGAKNRSSPNVEAHELRLNRSFIKITGIHKGEGARRGPKTSWRGGWKSFLLRRKPLAAGLGLFAHVALCPALRLAVASAQGAAGLSSVPVAPPGRQSSPHFAPARRGAR